MVAVLSKALPLSAKDLIRFTPDRYSQPPARAAVEKAAAELRARIEALAEADPGRTRLAKQLAAAEADLQRFDKPPVYLVRVPTLQGRAAYYRDMAAEGADYPSDLEMLLALEDAAKTLLADDERAEIQAAIDLQRTEAANEASAKAIDRAMDILAPHDPRLRALRARRTFWFNVAPAMAARHFLAGADLGGEPLLVKRGLGGIATEEALTEHFPQQDVLACGWHALSLSEIDRPTAKN